MNSEFIAPQYIRSTRCGDPLGIKGAAERAKFVLSFSAISPADGATVLTLMVAIFIALSVKYTTLVTEVLMTCKSLIFFVRIFFYIKH